MITLQLTQAEAETLYYAIIIAGREMSGPEERPEFLEELREFLFIETEKGLGRI